MPTSTLRLLIAIVLIIHGIGHAWGIMSAFGVTLTKLHSAYSWVLTKPLGSATTSIIAFLIFLLALIGFVAGGLSLMSWLIPHSAWQQLVIWSSIVSIVGLMLFQHAFPFVFPNVVGAIIIDIAALVCLICFKWPPGI